MRRRRASSRRGRGAGAVSRDGTLLVVTRVELRYELTNQLTDEQAEGVARAHSHYGIHRIRVAPSLDEISVDYDASRLSEQDVERALVANGVPIERPGSWN